MLTCDLSPRAHTTYKNARDSPIQCPHFYHSGRIYAGRVELESEVQSIPSDKVQRKPVKLMFSAANNGHSKHIDQVVKLKA